ncbi:chemotaxis protein CheB [Polaromonas eurypsychrophila]|uniref:protein-glutamate methylesterase n=1 Tax=Polaromonas eurypsychrophila TaxID=1614635 RepID=A0A916SGK5_9BURK|nr:chemotaxis protein CheB [Polaromonas eurypsychrophila]GGA98069.1 chemotaxis protein CheB [Polaromonas eurypsychrophila]
MKATAKKRPAIEAVVIGASAGGVHALLALLTDLPRSFGLPVIVVLHLPEDRDSQLAEIFQYRLPIAVRQAADKESIAPATLYFAGPGYHLSVEMDRTFSLSCEEALHFSRPSVDILMESAADAYGAALAGILLTGANEDGAAGMARIKQQGGLTVVQDPVEAEVPTMPEAAIFRQAPDFILKLAGIRDFLLKLDRA